jgi:hypothetical protein
LPQLAPVITPLSDCQLCLQNLARTIITFSSAPASSARLPECCPRPPQNLARTIVPFSSAPASSARLPECCPRPPHPQQLHYVFCSCFTTCELALHPRLVTGLRRWIARTRPAWLWRGRRSEKRNQA